MARVRYFVLRTSAFVLPAALVFGLGGALLSAQDIKDLVDRRVTAHVVSVVDGDTIDVVVAPTRRVRVRLHGVDAPEKREAFSAQSTRFTRVLLFSRDVQLNGKDVDRYGRLVARVTVGGRDAGEAIVSAGLACTFHQYVVDPVLDAAQSRATSSRVGFWALGAQRPACVTRETAPSSASIRPPAMAGVIGNASSRVYHLATCRNATCNNCTRQFATGAEAEAAGFRAAGDCVRR